MMSLLSNLFRVAVLVFCYAQTTVASPQFLVVTDIHYGSDNPSDDTRHTDTGDDFLKITLDKIKELSQRVNFILVLGDLPTHALAHDVKKAGYEKTVFSGLYEADRGLKPMFYITGNNDSLGGNYKPFLFKGKSPLSYATKWSGACVHCKGLLIDKSHMRHDGYYSSYVMPGNKNVILIALNTVQWVNPPPLATPYPNQEHDALTQLAWLERQLKRHHAKQLLIAMHIPPGYSFIGTSFWKDQYLQKFTALLDKYHRSYGQITLMASHTHMDELRKIHLQDKSNVYVYITPAVSRIHLNNPGMKIYSFNKQMAIDNFITYYTSTLKNWESDHYQALGGTDTVFPKCHNQSVAQCLDSLSDNQICDSIEKGLFYGAKSDRVLKNVCHRTYRVN